MTASRSPPVAGFAVDLQWAQPWGGVTTDYDVFVVDSQGRVVAASAVDNLGLQQPFEFAGFTNSTASTQTVSIVIGKFAGAANPRLKFVLEGASRITGVEHNTSTGSDIVGPTIFGHNGTSTVGSTAAIPFNDSTTIRRLLVARARDAALREHAVDDAARRAAGACEARLRRDRRRAHDVLRPADRRRRAFLRNVGGRTAGRRGRRPAPPVRPRLSPAEIMTTLRNTGRAVATNGSASAVGGGYIDAAAALASVNPRPAAPSVTGATSGNGRATVSWTAARTNPDFPVTGYVVTPLLGTASRRHRPRSIPRRPARSSRV